MNIEKSKNKPLPSVGDIVESVDSGNFYLIVKMPLQDAYTTLCINQNSLSSTTYSNIIDLMEGMFGNNDYIIHKSHNLTLKINN